MIADGQELLAQCDRLVEIALGRGAQQAEASWQAGASLDVDIESDAVSGAGYLQSQGGSLRVVVDGRVGFAYLTQMDQGTNAADRAIAAAKIGPGKDYSLPNGGRVDALAGRWDEELAALDVEMARRLCKDLLAGAQDGCREASASGGGVGLGWGVEAIASSEGVEAWDRSTSLGAGVGLVLQEPDGAINTWESSSCHLGTLDGQMIGTKVAETVQKLRGATVSEGGSMDVILLPDAASELVLGFVGGAIDGDEASRGRSVWSDNIGASVAHAGLSIRDEPRKPDGLGTSAMDGEGLETVETPIIEGGKLRKFIFDSWSANQHGVQSTHHAVRGDFKSMPGTGIHHWVVEHQNSAAMDKLVGGVDDGYLVESVLGAHTANSTTGDFSITSPNVWRIKNGALDGASKEIAIGGNLPAMLRNLDGVSDAPRKRDGATIPALRFRDVTISV